MHIYSLGPKLLSRIFFKNPQLSIRSGAHKLFRRFFCIFAIFDRNFAKIVAPPSDENENYVAHLKEQSLLKKTLKTASKSGNKQQRNAYSNYATLERTVLWTQSLTNKKNKHHIFAPRAGAHCAIYTKLCMVLELVVPIKKGAIHFLIQRSFSYTVHRKIWPNLPTRSFSAKTL